MRHVILASVGSHGDVFPFIAFGRALRSRGNRVTLAANEPYRQLAIEQQFEFAALVSNEDTQAFLSDPDLWHPVRCGLVGARWGSRWLRGQYELLRETARDRDSVIAASPGVMAARLVQETLSCSFASVYHMPWMIPSCTAPPAMTSGLTLPCSALDRSVIYIGDLSMLSDGCCWVANSTNYARWTQTCPAHFSVVHVTGSGNWSIP